MGGLLAGLDALVVALALLGALLALTVVIRPLLVSVLAQAPFIGGWLASNVDSGLAAFQRTITAPANAALPVLVDALTWTTAQLQGWTQGLLDFATEQLAALGRIANVLIPYSIRQALDQAWAYTQEAEAYALGLEQQGQAELQALIQGAEAEAVALVDQARMEAQQGLQAAQLGLETDLRQVEQVAAQATRQVELEAQMLAASAEQAAHDFTAQVEAQLQADVAAVDSDLQHLARATGVLVQDTVAVLGGDINAAEAAAAQGLAALSEETKHSLEGILESGPWKSLVALVASGEQVAGMSVDKIAEAAFRQIRQTLLEMPTWTAQQRQRVQGIIDGLEQALRQAA